MYEVIITLDLIALTILYFVAEKRIAKVEKELKELKGAKQNDTN